MTSAGWHLRRPLNRILKRMDDVSVVDLEFIIDEAQPDAAPVIINQHEDAEDGCGDWRIITLLNVGL